MNLMYLITWLDASSFDEWSEPAGIVKFGREDTLVHTVGFIAYKTVDHIVLAGSMHEDGSACCGMKIPRAVIRSIQRVRTHGEAVIA